MSALVLAITALAIAGAWPRLADSPGSGSVVVLLAGGAAAAVLVIAAKDLVLLVIGLETMGLAGYALISSAGTSRSDTAAATYFVQGAVAAGLLLFGTAAVVVISNSTLIPGLAQPFREPAGAVATTLVLLFAALTFKVGGFPLHSWVPDAYETAEPEVAGYLASVPKVAGLVVLGTLMLGSGVAPRLVPVAAVVAAASVAFGTIGGLRQTSYRRMLGYSAIAQTGFALTPLVAGASALPAVLLMASVYAIATFGAFMAAEALARTGWDGTIKGLVGTGRSRPALSVALTVCLLSLTGIPLTAGFWGKFIAFSTAVSVGYLWLAAAGVIGSVISFGYYGAVLRAMWLDGGDGDPYPRTGSRRPDEGPTDPTLPATIVVAVAATVVLLIGIVPLFTGSAFFGFLGR
jgi:NADH-quinone oxidoreductase subunit N